MCHRRRAYYGGSPICSKSRGCQRYNRGCHHRQCPDLALLQRTVQPTTQSTPVIKTAPFDQEFGATNPPSDPPQYETVPPTDWPGAEFYAEPAEKAIAISMLGKNPGFVQCPRCGNPTYTATKMVPPNSVIYYPVAGVCYATGILAALPPWYLSKYGDRIHSCVVCGSEVARWNAREGISVVNGMN